MPESLLNCRQAAERLGITVATLYDWLGQSDCGMLVIRGQRVVIDYFQGGPSGQGRIRIDAAEVHRIRELMRVLPRVLVRKRATLRRRFPGIEVPLGLPDSAGEGEG